MACLINRNQEGRIVEVTTMDGQRSKLFDAIHSNVFLADAEISLKIYMNAFKDDVAKKFEEADTNKYDTGEPALFYKSASNNEYDNLEELLINEDFGEISMGFKDPKNQDFMPIARFTTKGSERNEFIASKVREGLLSADRVLGEDGVTRFKGKGEYVTSRVVTGLFVANDLAAETGNSRVTVNKDGTLDIEFSVGYTEAVNSDGTTEVIRTEQIPEYLKENPDSENATDLAVEFMMEHDNPRPLTAQSRPRQTPTTDPKGIENSLFAFLESLGFSVTTLESYRKSYNTRYGKHPDIQAIADISNRVVAFTEGTISIEDLSEEVAHIAIEAFSDQKSIDEALKLVHMTEEYAEFNEYYRNLYSEFFKGQELEARVNKEILGKILKREFVNRFNTDGKTQYQSRVIDFLKGVWDWFTNLLSTNTKSFHRTALDDLNKRIADSVFAMKSEDFQTEFEDNVNFFYNAMSPGSKTIEDELAASKMIVEELFTRALEQPTPNQADLDKMVETNGYIDILSSVNTIVGIAENQLNILLENTNEANIKGELISTDDTYRYEILKENMLPTIENIISLLRNKASSMGVTDPTLLKRTESLITASEQLPVLMSRISPLMNSDKLAFVDRMLMKMLDHFSLTDEQKAKIRKDLEGGFRDIGFLGKMFGLSSHSKNLALQLMSVAVTKISANTNRKFNAIMNKEIADIDKRGLNKYGRSIIHRDADGKLTNYFLSPRDYDWYDKGLLKKQNEVIARMAGLKSTAEVENLKKSFTIKEILKDETLYTDYLEEIKNWKDKVGRELRFNDLYYKERDARFDKANVSKETRDYLSKKNIGRLDRRGKYATEGGGFDLSKRSKSDMDQDMADFRRHLEISSERDSFGNIKAGLRVVKASELTDDQISKLPFKLDPKYIGDIVMLEEGQDIEELPIESRRALDIFNLNMLYREESKEKSRNNDPIKKFADTVKEIEDNNESAYDWLISNASLGLSSEFYDNLGSSTSYNDVVQAYINQIEDPETRLLKQALLKDLIETQRKRKSILKQNKSPKSGIEVDSYHMSKPVRDAVRELDDEIYDIKSALEIPYELLESTGSLETTEIGLNEDFQKMLTESGKSIYEFSLMHMSDKSKEKTQRFASEIDDYIKGKRTYVRKSFDEFITQIAEEGKLEDKTVAEIISTLKDEYAKRNVPSYFKRFQPQGYTEALEALKSGEISIYTLLTDKASLEEINPAFKYIEVNPEYSWSSDVNNKEYINSNFKPKVRGDQPSKLNDEFFNRYGISKDDYLALDDEDISKLTPTKNVEEYEFLVKMTNLRQISVDNYGGKGNKYQRPQISKNGMEKALTIHRGNLGASVKDFFTDIAQSKIDEKEYGEEIMGTGVNIKLIPKYYQQLLDDPSLVTENTLEAVMVDLKASIRYTERVKSERDVKAIEYKISQQKFKNAGGNSLRSRILKKGEVSGYYEKAQEMADYHLYGIRQNRQLIANVFGREVDFTQLFNRLTTYVRNINLALNPITDLTSYTTGVYNNLIDAASGEFYHSTSAMKATGKLPKMIAEYVAESGKMKKTSELNHLMEFFGINEAESRLADSGYGRGLRMANRTFFAASRLANLPVTPKNMLTLLYDYKFHNGFFRSFNDFSRDMRATKKDISQKEIEALWKANNDTFYSNITIDPEKGVTYNQKFADKYQDRAGEEFEFLSDQLIIKMNQINQSVDSVISEADKIAAQRDAIANAMLLHRGYFIINMTRKFKGQHFNLSTGQFDSGHYSGVLRSLSKLVKSGLSRDEAEKMSNMLEEHEKYNLKRAGFDTLGIAILIFLTNALLSGDDDDDTVVENLAQLIALRTTSESQSQNLIGIPGTLIEFYKEPIVQMRIVKDMWKGLTKEGKEDKLYKQILLYRRKEQLSDLQNQINAYIHFNGDEGHTLLFVNRNGFNEPEGSNE